LREDIEALVRMVMEPEVRFPRWLSDATR